MLTSQQQILEQEATEGVSTNIFIPCNLHQDVAPYWIINGLVYELFGIPQSFPFGLIPAVDSFTGLLIPTVTLDLDGVTFQCASFNENGMRILGTGTRLIIHPGNLTQMKTLV